MYEGVKKHLTNMKPVQLMEEDLFKLEIILQDMKTLLYELAVADPTAFVKHCDFQTAMIVKLLSTNCQEHKQLGEDMLCTLIETVYGIRPLVKVSDFDRVTLMISLYFQTTKHTFFCNLRLMKFVVLDFVLLTGAMS